MKKRTNGTTSPMNTGAFKRVFSALVVLLLAATLMVGAGSADPLADDTDAVAALYLGDATTPVAYYASAKEALEAAVYATNTLDTDNEETIGTAEKATVKLMKDATTEGGFGFRDGVDTGCDITLNLAGFTYTCTGPGTGSLNTESQAFHLTKGNTFTILGNGGTLNVKEGTLGVYMLIQSYCTLTLEDVTLDGSTMPSGSYTLSCNNDVTVLKGDVKITGAEDVVAFDMMYWPDGGYPSVAVIFDKESDVTINGDALYYCSSATAATSHTSTVATFKVPVDYDLTNFENLKVGASADSVCNHINSFYWKVLSGDDEGLMQLTYGNPLSETAELPAALNGKLIVSNDGKIVTLQDAVTLGAGQIVIEKGITFDGADNLITSTDATAAPILIKTTADVTLKNVTLSATGLKDQTLVQAAYYEGSTLTAPAKFTVQGCDLKVSFATDADSKEEGDTLGVGKDQFYGIFARPSTDLVVKDSKISVTGNNDKGNAYAIKYKPFDANNALNVEIAGNTLAVSGALSATGIYTVTETDSTKGISATISDNTLTATTLGIAKLVYYTPVANNTKMDMNKNLLALNGADNYVLDIMLGTAIVIGSDSFEINLNMAENTVTLGKDESTFSPVKVAQRGWGESNGADNIICFNGKIAKDNVFGDVTSYIFHDTTNLKDATKQTPVVLDVSGLTIETDKKLNLELVVPDFWVNGINLSVDDEKKGTLSVLPAGTPVTWTSSNTAVLTIDGSGNYEALAEGSTTITVTSADGATNSTTVTIYKPLVVEVKTTVSVEADGSINVPLSIETDESVAIDTIEGEDALVVETEGLTVITPGTVNADGSITPGDVTIYVLDPVVAPSAPGISGIVFSVNIAMKSSEVYPTGSTAVYDNLVIQPELDPVIVNDIETANPYHDVLLTFELLTPGQDIKDFDGKIVDGDDSVFMPLGFVKGEQPAKLLAFHIDDDGKRIPVKVEGPFDDGSLVTFNVYGSGFSSYAVVADNTPQNNGGNGGGSSSSGSSVWLTESQTQQPTETPTEQPTDTVPTDIPSTQPTATPSTPGFGVLAVLAGLGAVAVLRRQ